MQHPSQLPRFEHEVPADSRNAVFGITHWVLPKPYVPCPVITSPPPIVSFVDLHRAESRRVTMDCYNRMLVDGRDTTTVFVNRQMRDMVMGIICEEGIIATPTACGFKLYNPNYISTMYMTK
jgi:hypothetical protein